MFSNNCTYTRKHSMNEILNRLDLWTFTRFLDGFLGNEKSTNRVMHCIEYQSEKEFNFGYFSYVKNSLLFFNLNNHSSDCWSRIVGKVLRRSSDLNLNFSSRASFCWVFTSFFSGSRASFSLQSSFMMTLNLFDVGFEISKFLRD